MRSPQTRSNRVPLEPSGSRSDPGTGMAPRRLLGAGICIGVGICLALLEGAAVWLPGPLLALAIGIFLGRLGPSRLQGGAAVAAVHLLRAGIVLLGFRLSTTQVRDVGADALLVMVPSVFVGGAAAFAAASIARLGMRVRILLAAGTAICGNSAIAAIAPSIDARDEDVAVSVTTVTLYGTVALVLFPMVAHALGLGPKASGLWAGSAINDTSQVVAGAYSMSDAAGTIATVVKLARNLFIVPVALIASLLGARNRGVTRSIRSSVPWFVVAFIGAVTIASLTTLPPSLVAGMLDTSKVLILAALTGMGMRAAKLRLNREVFVPLVAGASAGILLAVFSLLLVTWVV